MFLNTLVRRSKPEAKSIGLGPSSINNVGEQEDLEYPYQKLEGSEIRLVRILPGDVDDGIECQMEHISLSSKPIYYALSYVWGNPNDSVIIKLDGQPLRITRSLHEALHQFRQITDPDYTKDYIWVDAICINQADNDEKSREVPRMGDIYGESHQVLIWLGPNGPPTNSKVRKMLRKAPLHKLGSKSNHLDKLFNPDGPTPDDVVEEIMDRRIDFWLSLSEEDEDDEEALRKVFGSFYNTMLRGWAEIISRPWFLRTWTIQEACIPADPIVYIGRHSLSLTELYSTIRILGLANRVLLTGQGMNRIFAISKIRDMRHAIFEPDSDINPIKMETGDVLSRIMSLTFMKQCQDPRDQIYGIIGLLDFLGHDIPPELMPDYNLPYEELYWKCTAYMLESNGDLRLLGCKHKGFESGPSWVADFRYIAFRTVNLKCRPPVSLSSDRRTLSVQGIVVGEYKNHIARCSTKAILPHPERIPESLQDRLKAVEETILKPSAIIRQTTIDDTIDGFMKDAHRAFNKWDLDSSRNTFRSLSTTSGEKSWVAKKKVNLTQYGKEYSIADEFSNGFMLLENGTVVRLIRHSVRLMPGDLVCLFKGSAQASVLRPCGEDYEFMSQCDVRAGEYENTRYDDDFWAGRETKEFKLI